MDSLDLPIGLAFALAQNPGAMKVFAGLPAAAQASLVAQARAADSREEDAGPGGQTDPGSTLKNNQRRCLP